MMAACVPFFIIGLTVFLVAGPGSSQATEAYFACTVNTWTGPGQAPSWVCTEQAAAMSAWSLLTGVGAALVWLGAGVLVLGALLPPARPAITGPPHPTWPASRP